MFSGKYDFKVHLLDADGVVFNEDYNERRKAKDLPEYSEEQAILASNQQLIEFIGQSINTSRSGQIESFSIRESAFGDHYNARKLNTSLYCKALSVLHPAVQARTTNRCKLEKYLMRDTWSKAPAGEEFDNACSHPPGVQLTKSSLPNDQSKFSMLYARMQRIVVENPHKKNIHVTVWDDNPDILANLIDSFTRYPTLIPAKITLDFMRHGKKDGEFYVFNKVGLKGEGDSNPFYEEAIRAFYNSKEYKKFHHKMKQALKKKDSSKKNASVKKKDGLSGKVLSPLAVMCLLHQRGLDTWQKLTAGQVDLVSATDNYAHDMLSSPLIFTDFTRDIRDALIACAKSEIKKSTLIEILLQKIQEANTAAKVRAIVDMLKSDANRALLHDKVSQLERGFFNYTWHKRPISNTFNNIVKMAKCRILQLYAQTPEESLHAADDVFLQEGRHWLKVGESASFSLRKKLDVPGKKEKVCKEINNNFEEHSRAIRRRYRMGG